jgi:hypothetical protein
MHDCHQGVYTIRSTLGQTSLSTPKKKQKLNDDLVPMVIGSMNVKHKESKKKVSLRILLDSGASSSIIDRSFVPKRTLTTSSHSKWKTLAGTVYTPYEGVVKFKLPEFFESRTIQHKVYVTDNMSTMNYDMIIGRDIMSKMGLKINFELLCIEWDEVLVPFKSTDIGPAQSFNVQDSASVDEATERIKKILDAKYEKADLNEIVLQNAGHLNLDQQ